MKTQCFTFCHTHVRIRRNKNILQFIFHSISDNFFIQNTSSNYRKTQKRFSFSAGWILKWIIDRGFNGQFWTRSDTSASKNIPDLHVFGQKKKQKKMFVSEFFLLFFGSKRVDSEYFLILRIKIFLSESCALPPLIIDMCLLVFEGDNLVPLNFGLEIFTNSICSARYSNDQTCQIPQIFKHLNY